MATSGRIVVGVDGSPASRAALAWAIDEARLRHAIVEAVHVWRIPAVPLTSYGGEALPVIVPETIAKAAGDLLRETVSAVQGAAPEVSVTTTLVEGHPAEALVSASGEADLLVVGSRGHGGFAGLLLGSVSNHVAHHARCPVVVIHQ